MWLFLLRMLKNPIVQWGLVILGAFLGYEAWKYHQQSLGADKQIKKQLDAAKKAEDLINKAPVPKTEDDIIKRLEDGRF